MVNAAVLAHVWHWHIFELPLSYMENGSAVVLFDKKEYVHEMSTFGKRQVLRGLRRDTVCLRQIGICAEARKADLCVDISSSGCYDDTEH